MGPADRDAYSISTLEDPQATAPDPEAGFGSLATARGNLPLEKLTVRARITALTTARTSITQTYRNPFPEPLEATYIFPLPDRAALTSLRLDADGRSIQAELHERGQARESYEQAVAAGRRAAIAEEERPGVFTLRVGNIAPGERVTVRLATAAPLDWEDGAAEYRFPLVVAPRYIPGTPLPGPPAGEGTVPDTDAVPDASRITPPVLLPGFPHPVRLDISFVIDTAGLGLAAVASTLPLEPAAAPTGEDPILLRVKPGARADRDLVLRLRPDRRHSVTTSFTSAPDADAAPDAAPDADAATGPETRNDTGTGTFTLVLLPPPEAVPDRPRDVVILLDRSDSMAGWKMAAARTAAARVVTALTGQDRFSVIAFDHEVTEPHGLVPAVSGPGSPLVPASARNRARAAAFLGELTARGGTDLLRPLLRATDLLADGAPDRLAGEATGRDRLLLLLTDGQVGNEDQVLRQLASRLRGTRVHTIGVDTAVNEGFLRRLAALGRGRCRLVESPARLEEAMEQVHRTLAAPLVDGLAVEAVRQEGDSDPFRILPGTLAPARLPALYPGVPVTITGRYRGTPGQLAVTGTEATGRPWRATAGAVRDCAGAAAALWARAHLRDLEDAYVTAEPSTWSAFGSNIPSAGRQALEELERRMVALSLRFGVMCRFTAYVAVDTRTVNEGGTTRRVVQPVEPAAGWAMLGAAPPPLGAQPARAPHLASRAALRSRPVCGGAVPVAPAAPAAAPVPAGPSGAAGAHRRDPDPQVPDEVLQAVRQERETLAGGHADAGESFAARLVHLRGLGARLAELLADLVSRGVPDRWLTPLWEAAELLQPLIDGVEPAPGELESLRGRAAELLAAFGADDEQRTRDDPQRRESPRRGSFWRR
jgi:Ca-activated chloride channel family protein